MLIKSIWLSLAIFSNKVFFFFSFELIDKKNYIGFPGFKKTGGFSYDNYLGKLDKDRSKTRIGNAFKIIGRPFDMHPNEYGNKLGFELIYEHYKKTFKI